MKIHFYSLLILFFLGGCLESAQGRETDLAPANRKPNIVVIMADDLGYSDLGCYGCQDFETPAIDALARGGVRFTDGYVSHPYCSPSRAGFLSGRYQQSVGHECNPPYDESNSKIGIDINTTLLPARLQDAGYRTALIGKWHLGAGKPFRPVTRGFTDFYGFLGGGHDYFKTDPQGKNYNSPIWRNHQPTADTLTYLTDDLTAEAERFVKSNQDHPFCLLLMYNAPHSPDQVTDEYLQRVASIKHPGRRRYAALVQGVDAGVNRIVNQLNSLSLTKNTLVIFLSDNGGRRGVSDNRPLRGNKGWLHEGGIRVPMIFSMPGTLPEGTVYRQPVMAIDLLPTALHMAGVAIPNTCDGIDLLPFLTSKRDAPPHPMLYWRVSGGEGFAVRKGDWKLVQDIGMPKPELYNLSNDLGENHDLSGSEPETLAQIQQAYATWNAALETPRWSDGHINNTQSERIKAIQSESRQFPMPWVNAKKTDPKDP